MVVFDNSSEAEEFLHYVNNIQKSELIRTSERLPEIYVYVLGRWVNPITSGQEEHVVMEGVPGWYLKNGIEMVPPRYWKPLS